MANKALTYAELTLGVHSVYEEAEKLLKEQDDSLTILDKAQDEKRVLVDLISDREADLISEQRGVHPDISATALDQRIRVAKRQDSALTELRKKLRQVLSEIAGEEYNLEHIRSALRIREGRLIELGGYFNYLAAVKQAENPTSQ